MDNVLKVKNFNTLIHLPLHKEGEIAYCEEEDKYYTFVDSQWKPSLGFNISVYDMNKKLIHKQGVLKKDKEEIIKTINDWFVDNTEDNYFLLYGRESNYFTLFVHQTHNDDFGNVVYDCITNFGYLYDIIIHDDSIEFWTSYNDTVTAIYLFEYDKGVVYYG